MLDYQGRIGARTKKKIKNWGRLYKTLATFSSPKNAKKIHRVKVWLLIANIEIHWCFTEKEVDEKGLLTNFLFTNAPKE